VRCEKVPDHGRVAYLASRPTLSGDGTRAGWTVGAGFDYAFTTDNPGG